MKNSFYYIFLLLQLNLISKTDHAQWVTKYDMVGPAGTIYDLDFFKSDTGIFVGFAYDMSNNQHALIMRTTDAGNTWNAINTNTIINIDGIFGVSCASSNVAYAGGTSFLIKTNNSGTSWDSIIFKIDNSTPVSGTIFGQINFTSVSNGLVINRTMSGGKLLRTSDNGVNWKSILASVNSFYTRDGKNIYALTDSSFKSSADSGVTWGTSSIPSDSSVYPGSITPNVYFRNANVGFITGSLHLIKTADGGKTWTKITIDQNDSFDLTNIQFIDSLNGFITATSERFFFTTDGGNTWIKGMPSIDVFDFIKPYYFNKNKGCLLAQAFDIEDIFVNNNLQLTTGINEIQNLSINIKVYPNPATNDLHIDTKYTEKLNVQMFDVTGKQVTSTISFSKSTIINTQLISEGIYFIRITDPNIGAVSTKKIIIMR